MSFLFVYLFPVFFESVFKLIFILKLSSPPPTNKSPRDKNKGTKAVCSRNLNSEHGAFYTLSQVNRRQHVIPQTSHKLATYEA